ncbi:hypothetical protein CGL27_22845 [Streptomyces sp. 11-1-2]|nr:hypothetical protein CGL27_22845 [Streptomyces sp. 11-1-2]
MSREDWEAAQEAEEAAFYRECEWKRIERTLSVLYVRQRLEGDSVLLRQRVDRLERLQQALCGSPEQLSA